ncbi:MAG: response regulator [Flavobacteriales bacterium]|nr:response regulator [Flavobacteriales bacterium]MCB9179373.1 response regulator [Flavobacteriales bacterium]HPF91373.1 response regulator [Flavobacteriales bacterium]
MKKILIIEDETIISFGYRLQLERMGFEVTGTARSSDEAEALLAQDMPDLIIMDIYLKGTKNGLELAQEIHSRTPVPILFLTASTKPEVISAIHALKECQYLSKPINADSLEDMLRRFALTQKA